MRVRVTMLVEAETVAAAADTIGEILNAAKASSDVISEVITHDDSPDDILDFARVR